MLMPFVKSLIFFKTLLSYICRQNYIFSVPQYWAIFGNILIAFLKQFWAHISTG
jgi:hypothetical protein